MTHKITRLLLAGGLAILGGCEVPAIIAQAFEDTTIEPVFVPANQRTVIFVDDPAQRLPSPQLAGIIAGRIGHQLKSHAVITDFVQPNEIDRVRLEHTDFPKWSINRVAREVGARQALYVLVEGSTLTDTQHMYRPSMTLRVKIVAAGTTDNPRGRRLFPQDEKLGWRVRTAMFPQARGDRGAGADLDPIMARRLAERAGEDVAKLFHAHNPPEPGSGFEGR
ncbi:MAG: hypothetical protein OER86_07345 [Phycisphaerae bacterium]|nr:hypothetical protein [Phycisphaerae bacterium]